MIYGLKPFSKKTLKNGCDFRYDSIKFDIQNLQKKIEKDNPF